MTVFDINRRIIAHLIDTHQSRGSHEVQWYGTTDNGEKVGSAVYFIVLQAENRYKSKKILLLK